MAGGNAEAMRITMIVCTVVTLIFMTLRFYCKQYLGTKLAVDDFVLAFSWLLFLAYVVLSIYTTKYGLGSHYLNVDPTLIPEALYLMPIGQFFAVVSVAVSKSSFILTLLRLVQKPWQKIALWFMLATINIFMLSIAIVQFYQCSDPPTAGCIPTDAVVGLGIFAAGYSAAMDLVLTAFPTLVIWKVQMVNREKVGVIASMSLGVIAGCVGIYKASIIPKVSRSIDFTYGTADVLIWLVAEVTSTIMAACIPFYRPLVRRVAGSGRSKGGLKPSQESYGLANRSNKHHNKLGSRAEVKGGFHEELAEDDSSDRGIMTAAAGGYNNHNDLPQSQIVRHTNIRVEYDHAPGYGNGQGGVVNERDVEMGNGGTSSYYWGSHAR